MGVCCSKASAPAVARDDDAKPVSAPAGPGVLFVDEQKVDPMEAGDEDVVVSFPAPVVDGVFEFELISGERIKLQDAYSGTFAVTESSARSDLIQEMGIKKSWVKRLIKTVMQTQNLTVTWRTEGNRLFCRRKIELAGGKFKMQNEFEATFRRRLVFWGVFRSEQSSVRVAGANGRVVPHAQVRPLKDDPIRHQGAPHFGEK